MSAVERLNGSSLAEAQADLMRCCGCARWADDLARRRPFADMEALQRAAAELWDRSSPQEVLEALSHHPEIGADLDRLREKYAAADWSAGEQAAVDTASEEILHALRNANIEYRENFGHIFVVCATGKSAAEMLALLRERLRNDAATELRIASREQAKITAIRLEKLE